MQLRGRKAENVLPMLDVSIVAECYIKIGRQKFHLESRMMQPGVEGFNCRFRLACRMRGAGCTRPF